MRCLLVGGNYGGQAANVHLTPRVLVVYPCNCIRHGEQWCGSRTHWHSLEHGLEEGDLAPGGTVYMRMGRFGPQATWVRYLAAGTDLPTPAELVRRAHAEDAHEARHGRDTRVLDDQAPDEERALEAGPRF